MNERDAGMSSTDVNSTDASCDAMPEDARTSIHSLRQLISHIESMQGSKTYYVVSAQLKEVSRAISRLEAANLPVPEIMRKLKLDLIDELSDKEKSQEALGLLSQWLDGWLRAVGQKPEKRHKKLRKTRTSLNSADGSNA